MEWFEGTPPETEFTQGIFFVRIEQSELGCKSIKFTTHVWYGDRWRPLRYDGDRITHYAYIDDPVPLEGNNFYEDTMGRIKCVAQEEVLPDLSTPPIRGRI
jgi:hypothetical protein